MQDIKMQDKSPHCAKRVLADSHFSQQILIN